MARGINVQADSDGESVKYMDTIANSQRERLLCRCRFAKWMLTSHLLNEIRVRLIFPMQGSMSSRA